MGLAEITLSPMALSLVSKVAPARVRGLMMGLWFVATGIGGKLTQIGVYWTEWKHSTFFALLAALSFATALLLVAVLKPLKRAMPGV
jgi:POT family proton-dependent oligopeptide transporter